MSNKLPVQERTNKSTTDDVLTLRDKTGHRFDLKADRVDQLFAHTERSLRKKANTITQPIPENDTKMLADTLLGRFGLKSSQDVIRFLKSPAGQSTIAKMNQDLASLAAIKDHLTFERLEEQLRQRRVMAFLLLGLLYKREAKAQAAYAHAIEEQEKLRHPHKTPETETSSTTSTIKYDPISIEAYASSADTLENALKDTLVEADKLEKEILANDERLLLKEIKYTTIYEKLAENDQFGADTTLADLIHADKKDDRINAITNQIKTLTSEVEQAVTDIAHYLEKKNEKEARALLHTSNALNIQISELQDMLSVIKGDKTLYKENGEAAISFNDADFILEKNNKLVKKDGKHYLLKTNQSLDTLSPDEREEAQKKYAAMNPEEMMSVKNLVKQYDTLEQNDYEKTKTTLSVRNEQMQQVILLLANQMAELQAAAANPELAPKQTPTPTPSSKLTPAPCTSRYYSESYKHMLVLIKSCPTEQSIDLVKSIMTRVDQSPELKKELNTLKSGRPIPDTIMTRLLAIKDLGSNWLDVRKPDLSKKDLSSPMAPSTPTPISINPLGGG